MTADPDRSWVDLKKVSDLWDRMVRVDRSARRHISWLDSPVIAESYLKKLDGKSGRISATGWVGWVKEKYVDSVLGHGLSLGCADGGLERHALSIGICSRFDAFDISPESIALAKKLGRESELIDRIDYRIADVNSISLGREKYDIAFASMSLHHFADLEHVFHEVRHALKPGSLFVYNEYVGPDQFQWTDRQLAIMNDLLRILPKKYRRNLTTGELKEKIRRPTIESMNGHDPSEAIRSSDIIRLTEENFEIVERIDYGGTLLHVLFQDIVGNFSPTAEEDMALVRLICYIEESLIKEKALPSDFSIIVARNGR